MLMEAASTLEMSVYLAWWKKQEDCHFMSKKLMEVLYFINP
jgi:hypothetical protein